MMRPQTSRKPSWSASMRVWIQLSLLMIILASVAAMPSPPSTCAYSHCVGVNRPFQRLSCEELKEARRCLRTFKHVCSSDLQFRSMHTMARQRLRNHCNAGKQRHNRHEQGDPREPEDIQSPVPPQVRSGDADVPKQSFNKPFKPGSLRPSLLASPDKPSQHNEDYKSKRFENFQQYCLSAAYNFTIGQPILSLPSMDSNALWALQDVDQLILLNRANFRKHRLRREAPLEASLFERMSLAASAGSSSTNFKPPQPMTPSMTCMIFGDPHIRTFDSSYQTCNCLGTRSLIEHPLFDVQITNSRIKEQFNGTGVTKVTVLIRRFASCQILKDLIYEADSISQESPSITFTDNSISNHNNMIRIDRSAEDKVVSIHLDHIGVRVYISQFPNTSFLNVIIKFRTATTMVNHSMVLESISPYSLCKSGCHPRELVDIKAMLQAAGVDINEKEYHFNKAPKKSKQQLDDEEQLEHQLSFDHLDAEKSDDHWPEDDGDEEDDEEEEDGEEDYPDFNGKKRIRKDLTEKERRRKERREQNKAKRKSAKKMLRASSESAAAESIQVSNELAPPPLCSELSDYYRLTCLYDVHLKGIVSDQPHQFAKSFDEVRAELAISSYVSSSSPTSGSLGHGPILNLLVIFLLLACIVNAFE